MLFQGTHIFQGWPKGKKKKKNPSPSKAKLFFLNNKVTLTVVRKYSKEGKVIFHFSRLAIKRGTDGGTWCRKLGNFNSINVAVRKPNIVFNKDKLRRFSAAALEKWLWIMHLCEKQTKKIIILIYFQWSIFFILTWEKKNVFMKQCRQKHCAYWMNLYDCRWIQWKTFWRTLPLHRDAKLGHWRPCPN